MPRRSPRKPIPAPPIVTNVGSEPVQTSQGISGRIFGLLKKLPMTISSPTKENQALSKHAEQYSESEANDDESEDREVLAPEPQKSNKRVHGKMRMDTEKPVVLGTDEDEDESEEDEEDYDDDDDDDEIEEKDNESDALGDDQCRAIMENYILETSTRTNLLRNRTETQFRSALRRRLNFEISRITPSIAQVTALDYHQRDGGVLRRTMEFVTRLTLEQTEFKIGIKRDQSNEELARDEMEKYHRKRKRVFNNFGSTSSKASSAQLTNIGETDESFVMIPSKNNQRKSNKPQSRSKPPPSLSNHSNHNDDDCNSLSSRLPGTPLMNDSKPARLAKRNESLISVNGSPVIQTREIEVAPVDPNKIFNNSGSQHEFTFFKTSKWKDLEEQLKRLQMSENERKKIDEMLNGLKMG
ncbi:hypothetical protein BY996DRAFT_6804146 [Phakopsora pachyrhizi]|nr:hypothetical protein BY996DRAFT_6804146 [Phakopsora pachyrhizi]